MEQEFPAAYYGKSPNDDGSDQYRMLGRSCDFPPEALAQFEKLAGAIQWSGGGGNSPYSPCYAVWPVGEMGAIIARLIDSGPDHLNRPHTLRIEAAWIDRNEIGDWPCSIGTLLQDGAWVDSGADSDDAPLRLSLGHPNPDLGANVVGALKKADAIPFILVASHRNYRTSGFNVIQDPGQPKGVRREIYEDKGNERANAGLPQQRDGLDATKQFSRMSILVSVLCLLLIATGFWQYDSRQQLQSRFDELDGDLAETKDSLKDETQRLEQSQEALRKTSKERDELQKLREQDQEFMSKLNEHGIKTVNDLDYKLKALDDAEKSGKSYHDSLITERLEGLKPRAKETIEILKELLKEIEEIELSIRD